MKVSEIIAGQKLITARMDTRLGEIAEQMGTHHITGVPIVDDWGALAGLVTASTLMDLARAWSPSTSIPSDATWGPVFSAAAPTFPWQKLLASDVMTSDICSVMHDADLPVAAKAMVNRGVHRAVVLGKDRNVLGVLSALDVVLLVAEGKLRE